MGESHLQGVLLARVVAEADALRQALPAGQAVHRLLVVADAEAQVLQQRRDEGGRAEPGCAGAALRRAADQSLQREVQVQQLPAPSKLRHYLLNTWQAVNTCELSYCNSTCERNGPCR